MMIHDITQQVGKYKARKRVGRGDGSGTGKTSGRGHKGAKSRSGWSRKAGFEGGQMPFFRRIAKRGFSNVQFATVYHVINLKTLEAQCDAGPIDAESLAAAGIIRDAKQPLKILGEGELSKAFQVTAAKFSESARKKIEAAGGSVTVVEKKKWVREPGPKKAKAAAPAASDGDAGGE